VTVLVIVAVVAGVYFLLNYKPAAARDSERRLAELTDKNRDHYRDLRKL